MRRRGLARAAIVGHRGEPAAARDAHPRSHGLEIAARQDRGAVFPEVRRRRRPGVELVAVRRDDEWNALERPPGGEDQAHTKRSTFLATPSATLSRSRSASKPGSSLTPS